MNRIPRLLRGRRLVLMLGLVGLLVTGEAEFARAQQGSERGFLRKVYRDEDGAHRYTVFVPHGYDPRREWPVILYLHGAGERGTDGWRPVQVGLGPFVNARAEDFPFLVVFPQAEMSRWNRFRDVWSAEAPAGRRALGILKQVEQDYNVDPERRILTGWSMGGYGTWNLAAAHPDRFSAVVPVSGGGRPRQAERMGDVPVWAFHGGRDRLVLPRESREVVDALRDAGENVHYTEIPQAGHDVWKIVYGQDALYRWMSNPRRAPTPDAPFLRAAEQQARGASRRPGPFRPALEIPRAGFLRLGNDALQNLGRSLPALVPDDLLTGRVRDVYDTTVQQGRTFGVSFTGIVYRGNLQRAAIEAYAPGRLNFQLGLRNLVLTIGQTYVRGESRSAVAGPIDVVIGYREPVWLSIDVRPDVRDRRLQFELLDARFTIPEDNWYVTAPAGVSTEGLGMTEERVSSGLVSGLYQSKNRIEQQVLSAVPSIIPRIEEQLDLQQLQGTGNVAEVLWPLPVYQSEVRLWPQTVQTDDRGVSLQLGLSVAALDPRRAPRTPRQAEPVAPPLDALPREETLQIGAAPGVIRPLSALLIETGMARIHVRDVPGEAFAALADRQTLAEAVPDLKRYPDDADVAAELVLAEPLAVQDTPEHPTLRVQRAVLAVAVRTGGAGSGWTPVAEFPFSLAQPFAVEVVRPTFTDRVLRLSWIADPEVELSGGFVDGYEPENPELDRDRLRELVAQNWQMWTEQAPFGGFRVPDVELEGVNLRIGQINWQPPYYVSTLAESGIRIANRSDQPLVYEARGPYSGWGGPYTLPPGESHDYNVAYSMLYRQRTDGRLQTYTLPAGSHLVFRAPEPGGPPRLFRARGASATSPEASR